MQSGEYELKEITVNKNDASQRIDKFISKTFKTMPQSLVYKFLRTKRIKVNGKKAKENQILNENDVITLYIPEEFFGEKRAPSLEHIKSDIKVCFEDENVMIVHKPKGVLCHSEDAGDTDTMIDRVKAYLYSKGEYSPENENSFAPSLCNRIDRNTEGLVIAAKNAESLRIMNEIIRDRDVEKTYLAAVHGLFDKKAGVYKSFLEKNAAENKVYTRSHATENTVTAILSYKVVAENRQKSLSLLEIELETGRTHQIRVQMAENGHPLLGDGKYAVNKEDRKSGFSSQALCSYSVKFKFTKDRGILNYLNGVTAKTAKPDFVKLFY